MAALVLLIIGLLCAMTSRVLLFIAALRIGAGWAIGVLLPFGPLVFRLNYPEAAYSSRLFRFATLPCLVFYFILGPGPGYRHHFARINQLATASPLHYGLEGKRKGTKTTPATPGPTVQLTPSVAERRAANFQEFQRLRAWSDALKLRKRDLLHSDTEGNRAYDLENAEYNAALAKATAERTALAAPTK